MIDPAPPGERRIGLGYSFAGALCSAIYLFPYKRAGLLGSPDLLAYALLIVAGLFGPFLGRIFIMYSLRTLRAAHSALLLLLAPVIAFAIGFIGFGSVPSAREAAGAVIMLIGIALPSLASPRADPLPDAPP